ncbi:MAG: cytochrome c family protein [Alphaproteobacteria bacterium]|nr:cytochrome c family protein [Alphaproteobacteria bacterium]
MGGEFYKVWGAVLVASTVALGIGIVINEATHAEHLVENAYKVDTGESQAQVAAAPVARVIEPVIPLLASADAAAGEKAFKRCATCHTVNKGGANKIGPNLYGIVGANKGLTSGFSYSNALTSMAGQWSYPELNAFLTKPKEFMKGTKMNFAGVKSVKDRANIIAYLRANADAPFPIPSQ